MITPDSKYRQSFRIRLLFAVLLATTCFSFAAEPSFNLELSAWDATHIVLVSATAEDGTFEVVESWKGELPPGHRISSPEMIPASDSIPVSLYSHETSTSPLTERIPKQTAGLRVVLFLSKTNFLSGPLEHMPHRYGPIHTIKQSAVWIDEAKLYGFQNHWGVGPSSLEALRLTEAEMKARVDQVIQTQQNLANAIQIEDGARRAQQLKIYVKSEIFLAQYLAFKELGKTGVAGLPVLRAMLDDPEYSTVRSEVMRAYVQAGGASISMELVHRLKSEVDFWKATAPSLHEGWWNEDARENDPLREKYSETLEIVRGLKNGNPSTEALSTVTELRDLWRSLPQLNDSNGINQMADACDEVIQQQQAASH